MWPRVAGSHVEVDTGRHVVVHDRDQGPRDAVRAISSLLDLAGTGDGVAPHY